MAPHGTALTHPGLRAHCALRPSAFCLTHFTPPTRTFGQSAAAPVCTAPWSPSLPDRQCPSKTTYNGASSYLRMFSLPACTARRRRRRAASASCCAAPVAVRRLLRRRAPRHAAGSASLAPRAAMGRVDVARLPPLASLYCTVCRWPFCTGPVAAKRAHYTLCAHTFVAAHMRARTVHTSPLTLARPPRTRRRTTTEARHQRTPPPCTPPRKTRRCVPPPPLPFTAPSHVQPPS